MNRVTSALAALAAALIAQVALAPYIAIGTGGGARPNFLLLVVVVMAFVTGSLEGAVIGFFAGLLYDLTGTAAVGPMALTLTLTGYAAGMLQEHIFAAGWLLPTSILGAASLLAESLFLLLRLLLGESVPFGTALASRVIPGALYTMFVGVLIFPPLARFLRRSRETNVSTFTRIG